VDALARLNKSLAGRYIIESEIGRGGMAAVYLAQDQRQDRPVALKLFDPQLGANGGADRFLAEIRITARLRHPGLVRGRIRSW
jgi:serine/threonine-protein kinase